jgi:Sel1 repeat
MHLLSHRTKFTLLIVGLTVAMVHTAIALAMSREEIIIAAEKRDYGSLIGGLVERAERGDACSAFSLAMYQLLGIAPAGQPLPISLVHKALQAIGIEKERVTPAGVDLLNKIADENLYAAFLRVRLSEEFSQYQDGRAEQLHKRILDYLIPAAESGDPEAQWNLSAYYAEAWHGFPKDLKKSEELLLKAARQGHVGAQSDLGIYYETVTESWTEAAKWLQTAANAGDGGSQRRLSKYYVHGGHVPKDNFHAVQLLKQAAQAGNDDAQNELGEAYLTGEITPRNYVEAAKWLKPAAEQGNALAMGSLGGLFKDGNGVAKNLVEADKWFTLARRNQDRDEVEKEMTQTQISQAQALASSWKPTLAGVLRDTFFSVKSRRSCSLGTDQ